MARLDGRVVFVHGALPGERVRVRIEKDRARFAEATAVEILEPSLDRVSPRCPHAGLGEGDCGGCAWQHIDAGAQLVFKTEIVREQLQRMAGLADPPVLAAIASPSPWAYRHHVQVGVGDDGRAGFKSARSDRVVPIRECPISVPEIVDWLRVAPEELRPGRRWEIRRGWDRGAPLQVWTTARPGQRPAGEPALIEVSGRTFQVSPGSFFQVNVLLLDTLVASVLAAADVHPGERVLDGYCGVGLFSAFLADRASRVLAIESNGIAVDDARRNLEGLRVDLQVARLEQALPKWTAPIDVAVIDPPRAGCVRALPALLEKAPSRLVYVSCDPATLARDTRRLLEGGYELISAQPIDLFPQTHHIETIATFRR